MTVSKFYLPDVGEGLTEAEIVSWKVKPGDSVAINDVLVVIETAKSLVELPSPYEGQVGELLAKEGETVEVGTAIITIATAGHSMLTSPTPTLAQAAMANEVFVTDDSEMMAVDAKEEAPEVFSLAMALVVMLRRVVARRRTLHRLLAAPAVVTPHLRQLLHLLPSTLRLPVTEAVPLLPNRLFASLLRTWM
jgi:pyruvate dehydrogenase E2 component (dihydrolipoamide acetyltransferase)